MRKSRGYLLRVCLVNALALFPHFQAKLKKQEEEGTLGQEEEEEEEEVDPDDKDPIFMTEILFQGFVSHLSPQPHCACTRG